MWVTWVESLSNSRVSILPSKRRKMFSGQFDRKFKRQTGTGFNLGDCNPSLFTDTVIWVQSLSNSSLCSVYPIRIPGCNYCQIRLDGHCLWGSDPSLASDTDIWVQLLCNSRSPHVTVAFLQHISTNHLVVRKN
jgi:hypothetical protein